MAGRRPRYLPVRKRDTRTAKQESRYVSIFYKRKVFATQALSQTQENVSEPQTGIEPDGNKL